MIHIAFKPGTIDRQFPAPIADNCLSCHVDYHQAAFVDLPGGANCANCHNENSWTPSHFDTLRHNRQTRFPLTGRHLSINCASCHRKQKSLVFHFDSLTCQTCHQQDNPHGTQFATPPVVSCEHCHTPHSWKNASLFTHENTSFPLTGAHQSLPCTACHTPTPEGIIQFRGIPATCTTCHEEDNPHFNQFADRKCTACHDTNQWKPATRFDHQHTRFPLTGAHINLSCKACHPSAKAPNQHTFVRYRPLGTKCIDCHG